MTVWAQTLVKNEEKWLWYAVTSVIEHVDKILLWDTGSTDGSREIEKELKNRWPEKIELKERIITSASDFTKARQEMLDETTSDWFVVLDGDEIWYEDSIKKVIKSIKSNTGITGEEMESIVVPTINLVGDIYHRQEEKAGRYKFGNRVGHYNLRGVNRKIPGLHSEGAHGVWGWVDGEGRAIQDRDEKKVKFLEAPYLHTTFLPRGGGRGSDLKVIKRQKKLKYELGEGLPLDFYYPEALFGDIPDFVPSPWGVIPKSFKFRAFFETPLRKIKRRIWKGKVGY
jgi:glycosyltransferase involved in cell wall biosynthesis